MTGKLYVEYEISALHRCACAFRMTDTRLTDIAGRTHGMQPCLMRPQWFLAVLVHALIPAVCIPVSLNEF